MLIKIRPRPPKPRLPQLRKLKPHKAQRLQKNGRPRNSPPRQPPRRRHRPQPHSQIVRTQRYQPVKPQQVPTQSATLWHHKTSAVSGISHENQSPRSHWTTHPNSIRSARHGQSRADSYAKFLPGELCNPDQLAAKSATPPTNPHNFWQFLQKQRNFPEESIRVHLVSDHHN